MGIDAFHSMLKNDLKRLLLALRNPIDSTGCGYNTRNSSKGALLTEAKILFSYLVQKNSLDSARQAVLQENIFAKRTHKTRKLCWEILHSRYLPSSTNIFFHPIIALFQANASDAVKRGVLYYHYSLSDLFSYEATVELVYSLHNQGMRSIAPRDVHRFLESKIDSHPEISDWSPQTRRSLVSHYLSAVRDFGILEGKVKKRIGMPVVGEDLFLYIVTYLRDCGKSPRGILSSNDFRLFLLSEQEVELRLVDAHQKGRIRFQRSGRIISLEFPWGSILEYIKNIGQQV